jgi:phosphoribosylformimino-5-aminoimidazole carboxamide ribotide isomerase
MIQIIPAIDIIDGKCVRLSQGDFSRSIVYSDDPLDVAKRFEDAGLHRLHIVDLDGAKTGNVANLKTLESIARNTGATIDFGGGIRVDEDIRSVFDAGADMVSVGSVAVRSPGLFFKWVEDFGTDKILLGADVRDGSLCVDGWQTGTEKEVVAFLKQYFAGGVEQAFVTDITKDGILKGPALALYKQIREAIPHLKLIASGGVSRVEDIDDLERIGCEGVIVGKAIYEGQIDLAELRKRQVQTG